MNVLEISEKHGRDMYKVALQHALSLAEIYKGDDANEAMELLIIHLQKNLAEA